MFSKAATGILKTFKFTLSPLFNRTAFLQTAPAVHFNVAAQSKPSTSKVVAVIGAAVNGTVLSKLPTSILVKHQNHDYVIGRRFFSELLVSKILYDKKEQRLMQAWLDLGEKESQLKRALAELNNIKLPIKLCNEINFYEDVVAPPFSPAETDLKGYEGSARTIQERTLIWKYILSLNNPSAIALKNQLREDEYDSFAKAVAVLYMEIERYFTHTLKSSCTAFSDAIPPFEVKEEYGKYIAVIMRTKGKTKTEEKNDE